MCYNVTIISLRGRMELRTSLNLNNENNNLKIDKVINNLNNKTVKTKFKSNSDDKAKGKKVAEQLEKERTFNIHQGHRARLKAQFLQNDLEGLTDIQKLELMLFFAIPQKDTNPLAHNLINHFGSLKKVLDAEYDELITISGIKENAALLITMIKSFKNYYFKPECKKAENLNSTVGAIEYAEKLFYGSTIEEFYVICLSKDGTPLNYTLISRGTLDEVNIQIRTVTQVALNNKVNRIIICHNHPAGPARMSDEDYSITYSIVCSCVLNSIDVLDHIIVGTDKSISLHECNIMEKIKNKAVAATKITKDTELFLSSSSELYKQDKVMDIGYEIKD